MTTNRFFKSKNKKAEDEKKESLETEGEGEAGRGGGGDDSTIVDSDEENRGSEVASTHADGKPRRGSGDHAQRAAIDGRFSKDAAPSSRSFLTTAQEKADDVDADATCSTPRMESNSLLYNSAIKFDKSYVKKTFSAGNWVSNFHSG